MIKEVVVAKGTEVTIRVPEELANKELEVTIRERHRSAYEDDMSFEEAKAYFQKLRVDLSQYKFNRDEANGF